MSQSALVIAINARIVKQEIAKEGILPYSLFFAESYGLSLSGIFGRKPKSKVRTSYHTNFEKTPAATLALHWVITTILVVAPVLAIVPVPYNSTAAYAYITTAFVYDIDVVYFAAVAFGLLCLRFTPSVRWAEKSAFKRPWVSITAASVLLVGCLFPLIFIWVPDPAFPQATRTNKIVPWWGGQTLAVCFLLFAFLYWVAFRMYIQIRSEREGKTLHVKREPIFKQDTGGLTQIFEIVTLQWRREVGMRLDEIEETDDGYRSSTIQSSSPPPNSNGRLRQYDGWEGRASPGLGPNPTHEMGMEQSRFAVRRKPVLSELVA